MSGRCFERPLWRPINQSAVVAKETLATNRTLREVVLGKKLMDAATLDRALDPLRMTQP
ncbi:MAG: hypothetical protein PSV13_10340 [Lacunisphaera sp.]|nr:hypothetical protein [Lacunisphaera sp.]